MDVNFDVIVGASNLEMDWIEPLLTVNASAVGASDSSRYANVALLFISDFVCCNEKL